MSIDNTALQKASSALGVLEQLQSVYADLLSLIDLTVPQAVRGEHKLILDRLKAVIEVLGSDPNQLSALLAGQSLSKGPRSTIDRLKLGGIIIKMREHDGKTLQQISDTLKEQGYGTVGIAAISTFFKLYDQGTTEFRNRQQRVSVFDTAVQLEHINTLIWQALSKFADSPDQYHKYLDQAQRLVKQASDYLDRSSALDKYEQLRTFLIEILADELPEKRERIISRINSLGQNPFMLNQAIRVSKDN
jgi:hypothetical protein